MWGMVSSVSSYSAILPEVPCSCVLDNSLLVDTFFANTFSQSVACFLILLTFSFIEQKFLKCFLTFIYYWETERQSMSRGGAERGGDRIWSRLQALSCEHRVPRWAWTHEPWDYDLSQNWTLNQLSYPGAPRGKFKVSLPNRPSRDSWLVANEVRGGKVVTP